MEFEPWTAALAAFLVVVQVVLVMAPGVYYTRKGVIDTSARRKLSIISFSLLLPANNFYHIAKNVSADTITQYLPFAANTVLSNVLGMICGWLSNWLAGTPRTLRYHVVAAAGFGNLNSLPLLIATAICNQDSLPFQQVLKDQCSSVGYGYVAVGTAATQMFTYPLAIWLLKKRPEPRSEPEPELAEVVVAPEQPGSSAQPSACRTPSTDTLSAEPAHAAAADLDSAHSQAPEKADVGGAADAQPGHAPDAPLGDADAPQAPLREAAVGAQAAHAGSTAPVRTPSSRRAALQSFAVDFSSDSDGSMAGSLSSSRQNARQASLAGSDSSAALQEEDRFHSASAGGSSSGSDSGSGCHRASLAAMRSMPRDSTRADGAPTALVPAAATRAASDACQEAQLAAGASGDQKLAEASPSASQEPAPDPPAALRMRSRWRRRVRHVWALGAALGGQQPRPQRPPGPPPSRARRWARSVWKFTNENVLRMPCIGAGLGLVVGVIAPLKNLLFPASSAPLGFLMGALFSIQAALIFNSSFVLGSTLAKGPGPGRRALGWRPLLLVVFVRLVLLPVVGAVLVTGFIKLRWYKPLDPVYAYILLQQFCVPTANQMQNIASMSGNREQEMGTLIFFQYVFAFVAIPAWMVFYLWLMDRFSLYPGA